MIDIIAKLPQGDFTIPIYFDYVATFCWALSGAIVGAGQRYDIMGIFVISLVSSMGGSLIRDGFFLQRTPPVLTNGMYLTLIAIAVFLTGIASRLVTGLPSKKYFGKAVDLVDAIGIPAFAVVGMELAFSKKVALPGVVLIGVINAVGGGLLRDILCGQIPRLLLPGQFSALIVCFSSMVYAMLVHWGRFDSTRTAIATIIVFFIIRVLTIRYNWRTRAILPEDQE